MDCPRTPLHVGDILIITKPIYYGYYAGYSSPKLLPIGTIVKVTEDEVFFEPFECVRLNKIGLRPTKLKALLYRTSDNSGFKPVPPLELLAMSAV